MRCHRHRWFTGNIALKTGEGTANLIGTLLREAFAYTPYRACLSLALTSMRRLKNGLIHDASMGVCFWA